MSKHTDMIGIMLPTELKQDVRVQAARNGKTMSRYILELIKKDLRVAELEVEAKK